MIKFKAGRKPGEINIIGLGITAKNIAEMKKGNPIYIMGAEWNLPWDICLMYGESEQKIVADLRRGGHVGPETVLINESKKKPRN